MKQIRMHGRAGFHDLAMAGFILGQAALKEQKYVQIRPPWTPSRRGQPQVCFVRLDEKPIRDCSQTYDIDIVLVPDSSLVSLVDVLSGVRQGGRVIVNSASSRRIEDPRMIYLDISALCGTEQIDPIVMLLGCTVKFTKVVSFNSLKTAILEKVEIKERNGLMKAIIAAQLC